MKQSTPAERQTYEAIVGTPLAPFTARCFRSVDRESHVLLYIEDLTAAYSRPRVSWMSSDGLAHLSGEGGGQS